MFLVINGGKTEHELRLIKINVKELSNKGELKLWIMSMYFELQKMCRNKYKLIIQFFTTIFIFIRNKNDIYRNSFDRIDNGNTYKIRHLSYTFVFQNVQTFYFFISLDVKNDNEV